MTVKAPDFPDNVIAEGWVNFPAVMIVDGRIGDRIKALHDVRFCISNALHPIH